MTKVILSDSHKLFHINAIQYNNGNLLANVVCANMNEALSYI